MTEICNSILIALLLYHIVRCWSAKKSTIFEKKEPARLYSVWASWVDRLVDAAELPESFRAEHLTDEDETLVNRRLQYRFRC